MSDEKVNLPATLRMLPFAGGNNGEVGNVPRVFTYLDAGSREDQRKAANALASATYCADDVKGEPFRIVNVLAHEVMLTDRKTGETTRATRTVLFLDSGETVGFVSLGIYSCVSNFIAVRGPAPWNPPLSVKLTEKKADVGKMLLLELLE